MKRFMAVHNAEEFALEDRRVAVSLSQLAQVYAGHEHVEAEPLYRRSLAIRARALRPSHSEVAKMLEDFANALRK